MRTPEELKEYKEKLQQAKSLASEYFDNLMTEAEFRYATGWFFKEYSYTRDPYELADDMLNYECMDMADDYRYGYRNKIVEEDAATLIEQHKLGITSDSDDFELIYHHLLDARIRVCFDITHILKCEPRTFTSEQDSSFTDIEELQAPKSIFPTPEGTSWEDVTLRLVDDQKLTIEVGETRATYGLKKMGFINTKSGNPIKAWEILELLALNNNSLSWDSKLDKKASDALKHRITKLRKVLNHLMGLQNDPFHNYHQGSEYKLKARLLDKRRVDAKDPEEEDSLFWNNISAPSEKEYW